jgi:hypothetical protein
MNRTTIERGMRERNINVLEVLESVCKAKKGERKEERKRKVGDLQQKVANFHFI